MGPWPSYIAEAVVLGLVLLLTVKALADWVRYRDLAYAQAVPEAVAIGRGGSH